MDWQKEKKKTLTIYVNYMLKQCFKILNKNIYWYLYKATNKPFLLLHYIVYFKEGIEEVNSTWQYNTPKMVLI